MEKKIFFLFKIVLVITGLVPSFLFAATLSITPGSGDFQVGQTFTAQIIVSSADKLVNAVSGNLEFPSDKLSVVKLTKDSSVLSLWVQEPTYSNSSGSVSFEGVILGNGYQGASGRIINVTFKVNAPGDADIRFANGSILANDGEGTNILEGFNQAKYILSAKTQREIPVTEPKQQVETTVTTAAGPVIVSATHPNQESWYRIKEANLSWELPPEVSRMYLGLNKSKSVLPDVLYSSPITNRTLNIPDGVWYFSALFENKTGAKLQSQYTLRVDTVSPTNLSVKDVSQKTAFAKKVFELSAQDSLSGISHYEIVHTDGPLGAGGQIRVEGGKDLELPALHAGNHRLLVTAYDKAGNSITTEKGFMVEGFNAPEVKDYTKTLKKNDVLMVRGSTLPRAAVQVYLEGQGMKPVVASTNADNEGEFSLMWSTKESGMKDGSYSFSVDAIMNGAVYSERSPNFPITVEIGKREYLGMTGTVFGVVMVVTLLLLLVIASLIRFGLRKLHHSRTASRNEIRQLKKSIRSVLSQMRTDVLEHKVGIAKAKTKAQTLTEVELFSQKVSMHIEDLEDSLTRE